VITFSNIFSISPPAKIYLLLIEINAYDVMCIKYKTLDNFVIIVSIQCSQSLLWLCRV